MPFWSALRTGMLTLGFLICVREQPQVAAQLILSLSTSEVPNDMAPLPHLQLGLEAQVQQEGSKPLLNKG